MPQFRVTNFYSQANIGFSETYWKSETDTAALLVSLQAMLTARANILSTRVSFLASRVAIEGTPRAGNLYKPGNSIAASKAIVLEAPAFGTLADNGVTMTFDQIRACFLMQFNAGNTRICNRYFSGVPDQATLTEPATINFGAPQAWWTPFWIWAGLIVSAQWQIKTQAPVGPATEVPIIDWVLQNAAPSLLGAVIPRPGLVLPTQGQRVVVRAARMRAQGLRSPNGIWYVSSVDDATIPAARIVYLRGTAGAMPSDIKTLGSLRIKTPAYVTPTSIQPEASVIHKRGKPFNSPVGRRRTRSFSN